MKNLFGTDGIRGVAGEYPITEEVAEQFGRAVVETLGKEGAKVVLIARDTRASGASLAEAVARGVAAGGFTAINCGVLPTPAAAYLSKQKKACAAVVISASHNPYTDNGFKVFQGDGYKCNDEIEKKISDLIQTKDVAEKKQGGKVEEWPEAETRYVELAEKDFGAELNLKKFKIVADVAHGAAFRTTPLTLRRLGAEVIVVHDQPDGKNINDACGSNCPEKTADLVKKNKATLGLAHDGDADRVCFCDENGDILDGDEVLCILGLHMAAKKKLKRSRIVATVMSNCGLEEALEKAGIGVIRAAVGDRNVLEEMIKGDLNLGGEQSGHIILRDTNPTGDGLNTALQLLRVMAETGEPLSKLRKKMHKYPQILINVKVREKKPIEAMPDVAKAVAEAEKELGKSGRVLLRYSGTEPKIRLLLEAKDEQVLKKLSEKILKPIKELIGAE